MLSCKRNLIYSACGVQCLNQELDTLKIDMLPNKFLDIAVNTNLVQFDGNPRGKPHAFITSRAAIKLCVYLKVIDAIFEKCRQ